jgi:predicted component of type VI protein secretion system
MARIVAESGSLSGKEWPIDPGVTFGREAHNTIAMPENKKSSRDHAKVWREGPGRYSIADIGSTNGTLVNDEKITRQPLADGDEIRIGEWVFRFVLDADEKPKPKEPPASRMADVLGSKGADGGPAAGASGAGPTIEVKSRILQYSKKDAKGSVASWDVSQAAGGMKWLVILGILAVAAGLFYVARMLAGGG